MNYILTNKCQHSVHCKDGKRRNFLLYFLNGIQILKLKRPFNEEYERGFDGCTWFRDEYILNGRLHQTRYSDSDQPDFKRTNPRFVSYPLSKKVLEQFNIPVGLKIKIDE